MTRRTIAALGGALTLAAGGLLLAEHPVVSPGALAESHADLRTRCRACHTPFRGTKAGCAACHGGLPTANQHAQLQLDCAECHHEHAGVVPALDAHAGADCTGCHEHASITAVKRHRAERITRPLEAAAHRLDFSHRLHFDEIEDAIHDGKLSGNRLDCARCHQTGTAEEARFGGEHALVWSGCIPCHKDWKDAGLEKELGTQPVVPFSHFISPARLSRVRFRHSPGHLRTPCVDCHTGIAEAKSLRPPKAGADPDVARQRAAAAKQTVNCFGCHVHAPEGGTQLQHTTAPRVVRIAYAEEPRIVACVDCHEFHGHGRDGDFPAGPGDTPRPPPWDVLAHLGGFAITPWLLAFLGVGAAGYVGLVRWFPSAVDAVAETDPNVAPQRVSEVPALSPSYESSIPGLHIVGELAGVPLINRAMKSGFDAIDFIANKLQVDGRHGGDDVVDILIAGSGPAGLGSATRAKSLGLSYVLCEKGGAAATIRGYPRAKVVQTAPIDIPEYGTFFQEDDESKEALVRRWEDIIARTGLVVNEREEVLNIVRQEDGILTISAQGDKQYRARTVVLAIGVRGTPRRLGVAGEGPERVAYNLVDATEYHERRIMVVGGGNAACEAALALATPDLLNEVTLSHRGPVLKDVTAQNSHDIDAAVREGQLRVEADSVFKELRPSSVILETPGGAKEIPNDFIFALIGAELPTKFLRAIGVKLVKKGGL